MAKQLKKAMQIKTCVLSVCKGVAGATLNHGFVCLFCFPISLWLTSSIPLLLEDRGLSYNTRSSTQRNFITFEAQKTTFDSQNQLAETPQTPGQNSPYLHPACLAQLSAFCSKWGPWPAKGHISFLLVVASPSLLPFVSSSLKMLYPHVLQEGKGG